MAGHPHAGGENKLEILSASLENGPSPRGWGKRWLFIAVLVCFRAIPTRVGKTKLEFAAGKQSAGHPHAGGENSD